MFRAIKNGVTNMRKAMRRKREFKCYQLLRKEFADVNQSGVLHTLVIDEFKVAYNKIHKNGSSSMSVLWNAILSGAIDKPSVATDKLRKIYDLKESEIPKLRTYRWLLVTRNPYARTLSAFTDKFRRDKITDEFGTFDLSPSGFRDFVRWLEDGNLDKNHHWDLQTKEMLLPVTAYSDIIRLENLNEDVGAFFASVGVPSKNTDFAAVYQHGSTHKTGSNSKLAAFYDEQTQEKIYNLYEIDFRNLGYGPELDSIAKSLIAPSSKMVAKSL